MKKVLIRLLATTMALCVVLSGCAAAEVIKIYGDGTKKSYDIKDRYGVTYHYYDVFDGATEREDTKDYSRFLRSVLTNKFRGVVNRTIPELWDVNGRNDFSSKGTDIRIGGKTVYEKYEEIIYKNNSYTNEFKVLVESRGMAATELAIREKMAQLGRDELGDKSLKASSFAVNKELAALKSDGGTTFFSMNVYGVKGSQFMAVGSVFYDFRLAYLEDGKIADSAVGDAKKIEDVKGKRGVKVSDGSFKILKTKYLTNETSQKVKRTTGYNETYSVSMENHTSHTEETRQGYMVGSEITVKAKIPLLGETEIKVKGEYNSSWMSATTNGSSKTITESLTFNDSAEYEVPPHTKSEAILYESDGSYSIEYDYPVVILYKVAQYVIYNNDLNRLYAVWGETNDAGNSYAVQNLYNRVSHKNDDGYETLHSSGYPINWKNVGIDKECAEILCKYIPMSITGGSIGVKGKVYKIVIKEPVPIGKLSLLKTDGVKSLRMEAGGSLDLSAVAPVNAYDDYNGESAAFYGFDDAKYGDWIIADAQGNPATSELATLTENADGEWTLNASDAEGTVYIKYILDENYSYELAGEDDDNPRGVSVRCENDDVTNETLIAVRIENQAAAFDGTLKIASPVEAVLNQPLNLTRDGPEIEFYDSQGNMLEAGDVEFPQEWSVVGGNTDDISVVRNRLTVKKAGEYKVRVCVGGAVSDPVDVVLVEGQKAMSVMLDKEEIALSKGDTANLTATVYPLTASERGVTWSSGNESVVTVDASGKIKATGTGHTAIVATSVDGGYSAICNVTVEVPEDGKALDQGNLALVKGKSFKLGTPGGASGTWTVDDESIATVNQNGKVEGKSLGETTLRFFVETAKASSMFMGKEIQAGDVIDVPVAVRAKGEVVNKVNIGEKKLTIAAGATHALEPVLKPAKARETQVYYKTSDKSVVRVDDYGVITGISAGKAVITATSASGKTAKVTVTVTNDVNKIKLNVKKQSLVPGEVFRITATPVPADLAGFSPVFVSDKPEVATVDENGTVTAVAKGKATITVYAFDGSKIKAKCNITVKSK
ncbi:MAG: Ig-like domain-containing protein [Clostridia bacterium]|nr:Ig-like domain-containing protein [Clostridia bacterium]